MAGTPTAALIRLPMAAIAALKNRRRLISLCFDSILPSCARSGRCYQRCMARNAHTRVWKGRLECCEGGPLSVLDDVPPPVIPEPAQEIPRHGAQQSGRPVYRVDRK